MSEVASLPQIKSPGLKQSFHKNENYASLLPPPNTSRVLPFFCSSAAYVMDKQSQNTSGLTLPFHFSLSLHVP